MIPRSFPLAVIVSFTAAVAQQTVAQAQDYVRPDCLGLIAPAASLKFDTAEHAIWYRRFWTGSCKDLPLFQCVPGNPNWNDVVGKLIARGRPDQALAIRTSACRLGQTMGHEWSREPEVRKVNTNDLRGYMATLNASPDVTTGIARVQAQVNTALAGAR